MRRSLTWSGPPAIIGGMADPLTLALLGGVAATEGIKFLYGQAAEVIKAWKARRDERQRALEVPIVETSVLDAAPAGTAVDAAVLDQHHTTMVELWARLAPYAQGLQDVDITDDALARTAGGLRALLEAAYGQRFTFRSEHREPTGTVVTVAQALGAVSGLAVGVQGDVGPGATVAVRQDATEVTGDGTVIGVQGRIGG
jgi:hypothetical protein